MEEEATRNEQAKIIPTACNKSARKANVQLRLVKKLKIERAFLKNFLKKK